MGGLAPLKVVPFPKSQVYSASGSMLLFLISTSHGKPHVLRNAFVGITSSGARTSMMSFLSRVFTQFFSSITVSDAVYFPPFEYTEVTIESRLFVLITLPVPPRSQVRETNLFCERERFLNVTLTGEHPLVLSTLKSTSGSAKTVIKSSLHLVFLTPVEEVAVRQTLYFPGVSKILPGSTLSDVTPPRSQE